MISSTRIHHGSTASWQCSYSTQTHRHTQTHTGTCRGKTYKHSHLIEKIGCQRIDIGRQNSIDMCRHNCGHLVYTNTRADTHSHTHTMLQKQRCVLIFQHPRIAHCVWLLHRGWVHREASWMFNMSSNQFQLIMRWQLDCYQEAKQRQDWYGLTPQWAVHWPGISLALGTKSSKSNIWSKWSAKILKIWQSFVFSK